MEMLVTVVAAILGSGVVTSIVVGVMTHKKTAAEARHLSAQADQTTVKSAVMMSESMQRHIERLEAQIAGVVDRIAELEKSERELMKQNSELRTRVLTLETENKRLRERLDAGDAKETRENAQRA